MHKTLSTYPSVDMQTFTPDPETWTPMDSLDVREEMEQEEMLQPIPPADDTCWRD